MKSQKKKLKNKTKTKKNRNSRSQDRTLQHNSSQLDLLMEKNLNSSLSSNKSWSNLSHLSQDYFDKIDSPAPSNRSLPLSKRLRSKKRRKSGINLSFCKSPLYGKSVASTSKFDSTPKNVFQISNEVNSNGYVVESLLKNKLVSNSCENDVNNMNVKEQQLQDSNSDNIISSDKQEPSSMKTLRGRSKEKVLNTVLNNKNNQSSDSNKRNISMKQIINAITSKKRDKTSPKRLRGSSQEKQISSSVCKKIVGETLSKISEDTPRRRLRSNSREKDINTINQVNVILTSNKNSKATPTKRLRSSSREKVIKESIAEDSINSTKKTKTTPLKILRSNSCEKQIIHSVVGLRKVKSRVELQEIDVQNCGEEEIIPPSQDLFDEHNSNERSPINKLSTIPESDSDYSEKSMDVTPIKRLSSTLKSKEKASSLESMEVDENLDNIKSPDKFNENRDTNKQRGRLSNSKLNEDELTEKENFEKFLEINEEVASTPDFRRSSVNDSAVVSNFPKVSLSPMKKHMSNKCSPSKEHYLGNKKITDKSSLKGPIDCSINQVTENKSMDEKDVGKIVEGEVQHLTKEVNAKRKSNDEKIEYMTQDTLSDPQTSQSHSSFYSFKSRALKSSSLLYDSESYSSLSSISLKDDKKCGKSVDNHSEKKSLNNSLFSNNDSNKGINDSVVNQLLKGLESPPRSGKKRSSLGNVISKTSAESPKLSVTSPELRRSARLSNFGSNMSLESPDKRKLDSSEINTSISKEEKDNSSARVQRISSRPSSSPFKKINIAFGNNRGSDVCKNDKIEISTTDALLNCSTGDKTIEKETEIQINKLKSKSNYNEMAEEGNKNSMDHNCENTIVPSDGTEVNSVHDNLPVSGQGMESEDGTTCEEHKSSMNIKKSNVQSKHGSPLKSHNWHYTEEQSGKNDDNIDSEDSSESERSNNGITKSDVPDNTDTHSNKQSLKGCKSSSSDTNGKNYSGEEIENNTGMTPLRKSPRKRFKPNVERNFEKSPSARLTHDESFPDDTDIDKHYTPSSHASDSSDGTPLKNKGKNKKALPLKERNSMTRSLSNSELTSVKSKHCISLKSGEVSRSRSRKKKKIRSSLETSSVSSLNSNKQITPAKSDSVSLNSCEDNHKTPSSPTENKSKLPIRSSNSKKSVDSIAELSVHSKQEESKSPFKSHTSTGDPYVSSSESIISEQEKKKSKFKPSTISSNKPKKYSSISPESISRQTKTRSTFELNEPTVSPNSSRDWSGSSSASLLPEQSNSKSTFKPNQSTNSSKFKNSCDSSSESNPEPNLHHTASSKSNQIQSRETNKLNEVTSSDVKSKSKRSDSENFINKDKKIEKLVNETTEKESGSETEGKHIVKKNKHKRVRKEIFFPPSQESSSETDTNDIPSQILSDNAAPLSVITIGEHDIDVGLIVKKAIKALELPAIVIKRINSLETELIYNSDKFYDTIKKRDNLERLKTPLTEDEMKLIYNRWCDFCKRHHFDKKRPDYFFFNAVTKKFISNKFIKYFVNFLSQDLDRYISPQSLLNKFETLFRRKEELKNENKNVSNALSDYEEAVVLALEQKLGHDNVFKNYINPIAAHALNRTLNATRRARAVLHKKMKSGNKENKCTSETELNEQTNNTSRNPNSDLESSEQENQLSIDRTRLEEIRRELKTFNERIESMQAKSEIRVHLMDIMLDIFGETRESAEVFSEGDLSVKDWRFVSSQLKIPAHVAKAIFQTRIHPILFTERPINKYQLILDLICLFKERKYKEWNDIKWSELSEKLGNFKPLFLFTCLADFIRDNVPEDSQENFDDCMKHICKHEIAHLQEKIKTNVLLDICK